MTYKSGFRDRLNDAILHVKPNSEGRGKAGIAVHGTPSHSECHLPYGITQRYLPPYTSEHTRLQQCTQGSRNTVGELLTGKCTPIWIILSPLQPRKELYSREKQVFSGISWRSVDQELAMSSASGAAERPKIVQHSSASCIMGRVANLDQSVVQLNDDCKAVLGDELHVKATTRVLSGVYRGGPSTFHPSSCKQRGLKSDKQYLQSILTVDHY